MNATSSLARLPFPSPASLALFALVLMAAGRLPAEDSPSGDISFPPRSADFVPWRQQFYAYNLRTCGDIFRTTADHGQPWAKTAAHVLDDLSAYFTETPGAPSVTAVSAEAVEVCNAGCDDPMVLYACGLGYQAGQQFDQAAEAFAKAYERFKVSAYPAFRTLRCVGRLIGIRLMKERAAISPQTEALRAEWIALGVRSLHEVSAKDAVARQFYGNILGSAIDGDKATRELMHAALISEIAKGGIDSWLGEVVTAYAEIDRAWAARGGGYSNTVTEAGWKGFAEHLDQAETHFTAAWALDKTLAQAPAGMITVCMGKSSGVAAERTWMNRAISAQMDFTDAYANLFNAWLPRWDGTHAMILELGRKALATRAFDSGTPEIVLTALQTVARDLRDTKGDPNQLWKDAQVWSDIQTLFDGLLKEPSRSAVRDWDLVRYAAYAWRCGRNDLVPGILKRVTGTPDAELFRSIAHETLDTVMKAAKGASDF